MIPAGRVGLMLAVLMFAASLLAHAFTPKTKLIQLQPREKLEVLLPNQFGDWRGQPATGIVIADPQAQENLNRLYTEIVSRTYVDSRGRQIMLSIAYGEDQRDSMSMHYPEVCYPSQGFRTISNRIGQVSTPYGSIQVKRLEMALGQRHEPVTYWTMIGEYQSFGGVDKKLNEMRYGMKGVVPDGLLFRVSSIASNSDTAFHDHEEFVATLLGSVSQDARKRLAGL